MLKLKIGPVEGRTINELEDKLERLKALIMAGYRTGTKGPKPRGLATMTHMPADFEITGQEEVDDDLDR